MFKFANIVVTLIVVLISPHLYASQCLTVYNYETETCGEDPCYREETQELAKEIQDVNEYMKIVADELNADGVVVVRAVKTEFNNPDTWNMLKSEAGESESGCDEPQDAPNQEDSTGSMKPDIESPRPDENNLLSTVAKPNEMKQDDVKLEDSPSRIENLLSNNNNVEGEISGGVIGDEISQRA